MFSALTWFWIIYVSIGCLIMMEPLAQIWDDPEYQELGIFGKFLAAVISVAVWPLVFFVGGDND
jgi:hypothetical protein